MNFSNVANVLSNAYQYSGKTRKTTAGGAGFAENLQRAASRTGFVESLQRAASGTGFAESLQQAELSGDEKLDIYKEYLKAGYGALTAQNIGKDQKSMDSIGSGTVGTGNVIIAPNILEEMANNPKKAAYYEGKIQNYFNSLPKYKAELSAMGHEIHSSGIVIHSDGTVTHYISGDLKPEVRARIEARIKAEEEEKVKRRKKYLQLSNEAAEKRRLAAQQYNYRHMRTEAMQNGICASSNIYFVNQSQIIVPAVAAYEFGRWVR